MKKKIWTRLISCLLIIALILSGGIFENMDQTNAASGSIVVKYGGKKHTFAKTKQTSANVNGKKLKLDMPGIIINNTNLVWVKVFKQSSLGIKFSYNSSKKIATFKKGKNTIKLTMGSKTAKVNGKKVRISTAGQRVYHTTLKKYYVMVPARFVAETLGFSYTWKNASRTCVIKNKPTATATPEVTPTTAPTSDVQVTVAPTATVAITPTSDVQATATANATPTPVATEDVTPIITPTIEPTSTVEVTTPSATIVPTSTAVVTPSATAVPTATPKAEKEEVKAMWISYLEYGASAKTKTQFTNNMTKTFDNCVKYGMNTVIVQVRPFSDAMYESSYFPWSKYVSGTLGKDPGYDPLEIMVNLAHERGLKIQAWINPYRITTGTTSASSLPDGHPAKKWMQSSDSSVKRRVLSFGGNLYYNPSKSAVRTLIINGVKEIVKNYDVDGIHFDDYFYPQMNSTYKTAFDAKEYNSYVSTKEENGEEPATIVSWRRSNVNKLVKGVYAAVKEIDADVVFGISPAGNIDNLLSSSGYYANVKTWMSNDNYVDYICPQIYWSFQNKTCPYAATVDRWISLKKSDTVDLYIGLAVYRAGTDIETEWKTSSDVLKRQVVYGRGKKDVSGFAFYRYDSFQASTSKKELNNLLPLLTTN